MSVFVYIVYKAVVSIVKRKIQRIFGDMMQLEQRCAHYPPLSHGGCRLRRCGA